MKKLIPPVKFEDIFIENEATVVDINVKAFKQKEIIKPMIPDKMITIWGVFVTIQPIDSPFKLEAMWKLDKTVTTAFNDVPCVAVMKKKKKSIKNRIKESAFPTIMRALGVSELSQIVGTKIRIEYLNSCVSADDGFCISPLHEKNGRWFYPDYFEIINTTSTEDENSIDTSELKNIPKNITGSNDVMDDDLRSDIIDEAIKQQKDVDGDILEFKDNNRRYFVHILKGIVQDVTDQPVTLNNQLIDFIRMQLFIGDGCISQEYQEEFKQRFTKLYDDFYGREEENAGHDYGLAKMNKFLKKQNISYKIKVVYATDTSPRHWMIVAHDWSNNSRK